MFIVCCKYAKAKGDVKIFLKNTVARWSSGDADGPALSFRPNLLLAYLRAVQGQLRELDVPGGVDSLDAHSFCWLLGGHAERDPLAAAPPSQKARFLLQAQAAWPSSPEPSFDASDLDQGWEELNRKRRLLGKKAEEVVLAAENRRLQEAGLNEIAEKVKDVSDQRSRGYEIASFTMTGKPKPVEVRAASRREHALRFFLSENQTDRSQTRHNYTFAPVLDLDSPEPLIYEALGRDLPREAPRPEGYLVRLRGSDPAKAPI